MNETVLCIDDDPNLLAALQRSLRSLFDLRTAEGGLQALDAIREANAAGQPFAVTVCDMRMPGMNGIEVLSQIKELSPDTVRIMLTGQADQQTAIDAINQGNIFRFLTKPCPADVLGPAIQAGIDQYRLVTMERELLEKTVTGSVKMLVDIISANDPAGQAQTARLGEWVHRLTVEFKMPERWPLKIAASLLPIAQMGMPASVRGKRARKEPLTESELAALQRGPGLARDLIANIPRLARVAEIVYLHDRGFDATGFPSDGPSGTDIPFDARLLKILHDLVEASVGGPPTAAAFEQLDRQGSRYDPQLFKAVRNCLQATSASPQKQAEIPLAALRVGHVLVSDIRLANGHLIISAGTELAERHIQRIRNLAKGFSFIEPVTIGT